MLKVVGVVHKQDIAHLCGMHEQINDTFFPYSGYWATCAAAFTYLYNIDDALYREELAYPKDLIDFARGMPGGIISQDGSISKKIKNELRIAKDCSMIVALRYKSNLWRYFETA